MTVHGLNHFHFRDTRVPTNRQIQLLITDPDGLQLELIFAP
jgi:hypothetical protein